MEQTQEGRLQKQQGRKEASKADPDECVWLRQILSWFRASWLARFHGETSGLVTHLSFPAGDFIGSWASHAGLPG